MSDSELNGPLSDVEQGGEGPVAFRYPPVNTEENTGVVSAEVAADPLTPQVGFYFYFRSFTAPSTL